MTRKQKISMPRKGTRMTRKQKISMPRKGTRYSGMTRAQLIAIIEHGYAHSALPEDRRRAIRASDELENREMGYQTYGARHMRENPKRRHGLPVLAFQRHSRHRAVDKPFVETTGRDLRQMAVADWLLGAARHADISDEAWLGSWSLDSKMVSALQFQRLAELVDAKGIAPVRKGGKIHFAQGFFRRNPRQPFVRRNPRQSDVGQYQDILANLRALQWIYWTTHWTSAGPNFYGDHLLLQRLYEGKDGGPDIVQEIDALGERMVAYFGPHSVNPGAVNEAVGEIIEYNTDRVHLTEFATDPNQAAQVLLRIEQNLQKAIKTAWKSNQASGDEMSLGIDDYLMSLANERDTAIYLIQQRLGGKAKTNRGRQWKRNRR